MVCIVLLKDNFIGLTFQQVVGLIILQQFVLLESAVTLVFPDPLVSFVVANRNIFFTNQWLLSFLYFRIILFLPTFS